MTIDAIFDYKMSLSENFLIFFLFHTLFLYYLQKRIFSFTNLTRAGSMQRSHFMFIDTLDQKLSWGIKRRRVRRRRERRETRRRRERRRRSEDVCLNVGHEDAKRIQIVNKTHIVDAGPPSWKEKTSEEEDMWWIGSSYQNLSKWRQHHASEESWQWGGCFALSFPPHSIPRHSSSLPFLPLPFLRRFQIPSPFWGGREHKSRRKTAESSSCHPMGQCFPTKNKRMRRWWKEKQVEKRTEQKKTTFSTNSRRQSTEFFPRWLCKSVSQNETNVKGGFVVSWQRCI